MYFDLDGNEGENFSQHARILTVAGSCHNM